MPFWMLLVGIGTIVDEADPIIFFTIVVAAGVGAALGDWLSYWLGYYYHEQVQRLWPLRNHPELLDKGRAFFKRWGIWAIVLARFSGPLRASVPIVAGIAEMPVLKFQSVNWTSAFLWAFVLLSPGWGSQWLLKHVS
jgi:membrane protein DedA with SNARE-associated domain